MNQAGIIEEEFRQINLQKILLNHAYALISYRLLHKRD